MIEGPSMKSERTHSFRIGACLLALCLWATAALADERTWLWKVEGEGQPASYLYGTIHIDDTRVMDFSAELREAFHAVPTFAMESVPQNDMRHALMTDGSLADKLTEAELDKVRQLAEEHSLDTDVALRMKPWLLASIFSLPEARSPFTLDVVLYGKAFNDRKRIVGLETPEAHFNSLDGMPESDQLVLLRSALNKSTAQKEEEYNKIVDAYLKRDFATLMAEEQLEIEGLSPEAGKRLLYLLLHKRNAEMVESMRKEMQKGPLFVAVGASHLPGEQGMIALLRKAGYRVSGIRETPLREVSGRSD
jgi:uncharacterized protein YbaP (TraB family)